MECSKEMQQYFDGIEREVKRAHDIGAAARLKGLDPETSVEITLAKNMAERVVGLISVMAPEIRGSGVVERIMELEKKYSTLDWRVALIIAEEISLQKFGDFGGKKEAIEVGIRTGFAYVTVGVVSSPLEGFMNLDIKKRRDGGEYFCMNFAGPIRNAGGTAASVAVLIGDYVRVKLGYLPYDPDEREIKRTHTEISDYHERVTNLQYFPSTEESEFMTEHLPIEIGGDASEKFDVSNYKDLSRVPTNKIRSGFCLIHSSCIPLKAPKLWKQLSHWGETFDLKHWDFLEKFLKIQKTAKAKGKKDATVEVGPKIGPDYTYVSDLVAGRPILGHPLAKGAFRLRMGRSRTSGYSGQSIHPSTMHVLKKYIATGTQLKVERPGKGAAFTPCDTIHPPIVRLRDGSVVILETEELAKRYRRDIDEITFLGDVLVNYGDFFNRAHSLVPVGYCEEWWVQELEKAIVSQHGELNFDKCVQGTNIPLAMIKSIVDNPFGVHPTAVVAIEISKTLSIPLHPRYTYHWRDVSVESVQSLQRWLAMGKIETEDGHVYKMVVPLEPEPKRVLELIGVPHTVIHNEYVILEDGHALALHTVLGGFTQDVSTGSHGLDAVSSVSPIKIRDKSGVYIGARMGRPEKAKLRKLTGSPQVLFPIGEQGGRLRSFQSALEAGHVQADFTYRHCKQCDTSSIYRTCIDCGSVTEQHYFCHLCGPTTSSECSQHGPTRTHGIQKVPIQKYMKRSLELLGMPVPPNLVKGVRGTSNEEHIPENLCKGLLRAKHEIYVNKDGTIRLDASEITCTHFKPKEIGVSVERLKLLGYTRDCRGNLLENDNQVLELLQQDVILPACTESPEEPSDVVILRIMKFMDELLVKVYGLNPYYKAQKTEDIVGHLIIGLAPHTSAGLAGRIIGFSQTQGFLAHPNYHAANRRDCDGDELGFMLLLDAFVNFSRKFLPSSRGGTMDAPLVMTSILNPAEIDDMAFDVDIVWKYPLELYEAGEEYKMPWEVKIKQIKDVLGTVNQYEGMGYTHETDNFNAGVRCSAYKTLPSMEEKLRGQMELAEIIRAVDERDVARLVIEKHFIRDTKGNLRKFSQQQFRCVGCNTIYRRPPLIGKCISCGGKIIFTISEGSVVKYLGPSISLAKKYNVPAYLQQTLELLKRRVEDVFGKEKDRQAGLGAWFG